MFKTIKSFGRETYDNDLLSDDTLEQKIRLKDGICFLNNIQTQNNQSKRKESTNS